MRYIGNKENIIERIYYILKSNDVQGESFFDFFSGTTSVAKYYKKKGYQIFSSDIMYMSYCLQKAYIENNTYPTFDKLIPVLDFDTPSRMFYEPLEIVLEYLTQLCLKRSHTR